MRDKILNGYLLAGFALFMANLAHAEESSFVKLDTQITESSESPGFSEGKAIQELLEQVPGATNLTDLDALKGSQASLSRVLETEPGIIIQEFFGGNDQPRINIRGSGIQDNPVSRGIQLLSDGLALNQADGSFIIGLIDPGQVRYISTYRGANAFRYGAATLGGAINFHPRTASNSSGFHIGVEAGSFAYRKQDLSAGNVMNNWDYYLKAENSESDGWRTHSDASRQSLALNTGWNSVGIQNRTYINVTENDFDIPFLLSKDRSIEDPDSVLGDHDTSFDQFMDVRKRNPYRKTSQFRLANKSTIWSGGGINSIGVYTESVTDTFRNPAVQMDTASDNVGLDYSFSIESHLLRSHLTKFQIFSYLNYGNMPREYTSINPSDGSLLQKFADIDQIAANIVLGFEIVQEIDDNWKIVSAIQKVRNKRIINDNLTSGLLDSRFIYDSLNPKIGFIYDAVNYGHFFSNISRSSEAPTFWQLAISSPNPNDPLNAYVEIHDLKMQTANTLEFGFIQNEDALNWEVSWYYSQVNNELISEVQDFAIDGTTVNYDYPTIHQGIEFGLSQKLLTISDFGAVNWKLIYNWSDFIFDGGRYNGNHIAGIPEHLIFSEISWKVNSGLTVSIDTRVQPEATYVDHTNSGLRQSSYALFGAKLTYEPINKAGIFVEIDNITNEIYQTAYVVRGYSPDDPDVPTFIPGPERSFIVGVSYAW